MHRTRLARAFVLVGLSAAGCEAAQRESVPDAGMVTAIDAGALDAAQVHVEVSVDAGHGDSAPLAAAESDAAPQLPTTDAGSARDAGSAMNADAAATPADAAHPDAGLDAAQADYMLGADLSWVPADEARGATFSDGQTRDVLALLRSHGFNYVRLRSFVDPRAEDGYDRQNGFADLAHTIAFGKRIKAQGMGLLLDLHYSDNWADPRKQCVPSAWQKHTSIEQLASAVHDYTKDAITQLSAAGARPDLVQIGNEITPGMLLHVCDAAGLPIRDSTLAGRSESWANLGALLRAGVSGVKDVDPRIGVMLHIDRCGDKGGYTGDALETSTWFITQARAQGVSFEYFGESCYQTYQGDPTSAANTKLGWSKTLGTLVERFPDLHFIAAEYGPLQREINDVVYALPKRRGAGTFVWEPTHEGDWNRGHALFTVMGNAYSATPDLALYDAMREAYRDRL